LKIHLHGAGHRFRERAAHGGGLPAGSGSRSAFFSQPHVSVKKCLKEAAHFKFVLFKVWFSETKQNHLSFSAPMKKHISALCFASHFYADADFRGCAKKAQRDSAEARGAGARIPMGWF